MEEKVEAKTSHVALRDETVSLLTQLDMQIEKAYERNLQPSVVVMGISTFSRFWLDTLTLPFVRYQEAAPKERISSTTYRGLTVVVIPVDVGLWLGYGEPLDARDALQAWL
jgi:hypothetical protein